MVSMSNMPLPYAKNKTGNAGKLSYEELLDLAAHDLQAPIRKASVLTDRIVLKFMNGDAEAQEYIRRLQSCIQDMEQMLNSMVALGNTDKQALKTVPCDIDEVIQEQASKLGIDNSVNILTSIGTLDADRAQLNKLFEILLENSLKFRKENTSLHIEISAYDAAQEEKLLHGLDKSIPYRVIELADNGIGFDAAAAGKIFQPFVRLNGKSSYPGNGLGLAICEKIVSAHQGVIHAESMENNGARFIIILPQSQNN